MDMMKLMKERHSVRRYISKPLSDEVISAINCEIDKCNRESGLNIQLVVDEKEAFSGTIARYGSFRGVENYIALVGKKTPTLKEDCGYYGERLVLFLESLSLSSCWVGLTYKKIPSAFKVEDGEKLVLVIAIGYGENKGSSHKSKTFSQVASPDKDIPLWFKNGVEAALLAPTAVNQQKFFFTLDGDKVIAKAGYGFYTHVDLGISKYHFELGSGKGKDVWK